VGWESVGVSRVDAAAPQSRAWGAVGMRDAHMAHRREGRHDQEIPPVPWSNEIAGAGVPGVGVVTSFSSSGIVQAEKEMDIVSGDCVGPDGHRGAGEDPQRRCWKARSKGNEPWLKKIVHWEKNGRGDGMDAPFNAVGRGRNLGGKLESKEQR